MNESSLKCSPFGRLTFPSHGCCYITVGARPVASFQRNGKTLAAELDEHECWQAEKKEVRGTIWLCLHRSYTHLRSAAFVMIPGLQRLGTEMRAPRVSGMNSRSLQVQERLCKDTLKDFQVSDYVYMSSVPLYSDRTVSSIRCSKHTATAKTLIEHW